MRILPTLSRSLTLVTLWALLVSPVDLHSQQQTGHTCIHDSVLSSITPVVAPQHSEGSMLHTEARLRALQQESRMRFVTKYLTDGPAIDEYQCQKVADIVAIGSPSGPKTDATLLCQSETSNTNLFTNCWYQCAEEDILTDAKRQVAERVLMTATTFWTSALKVVPLTQNLVVGNQECAGGLPVLPLIPGNDFVAGVPGTDYVVYMTARPTVGNVVAYAYTCQYDAAVNGGRPVVGIINLAPASLEKDDRLTIRTAMHELAHALGFSSSSFSKFPNGRPFLITAGPNNKPIVLINTPTVTAAVREQFSCSAVSGGELEDGGGPGTAGSHWEARVFGNELMIGERSMDPVISKATLAVFHDSGWYSADFSVAETLLYGRLASCDFLTAPCDGPDGTNSWRTSTSDVIRSYYCPPATTRCSLDRRFKGSCPEKVTVENLPQSFQYDPANPTSAASNALGDYCPLHKAYSNGECVDLSNARVEEKEFRAVKGEEFAANAACFTSTLERTAGVVEANFGVTLDKVLPTCYVQACEDDSKLWVRIDDNWHRCPDGEDIAIHGFASGTLTCPVKACAIQPGQSAPQPVIWPTITSVQPAEAKSGELITLTGNNFVSDLVVEIVFDNQPGRAPVPCSVRSGSGNQLVCEVGSSAVSGSCVVRILDPQTKLGSFQVATINGDGQGDAGDGGDGDGGGESGFLGTAPMTVTCGQDWLKCWYIAAGALVLLIILCICCCCCCNHEDHKIYPEDESDEEMTHVVNIHGNHQYGDK